MKNLKTLYQARDKTDKRGFVTSVAPLHAHIQKKKGVHHG
jgi:hypothetical protein